MSVEIPPDKLNQILELLKKRQKIEAIKVYREVTGSSLKESKDAVEALERSASDAPSEVDPATRPGRGPSDPFAEKKTGCLGVILLGIGTVVAWIVS